MANGGRMLADAWGERVSSVSGSASATPRSRGSTWDEPVERMRAYLDAMDAASSARRAGGPAGVCSPRSARGCWRFRGTRARRAPLLRAGRAHRVRPSDARSGAGPRGRADGGARGRRRHGSSDRARAGRATISSSPNYASNLRRMGCSDDDVAGQGSDRLIDATIAWGDVDAVRRRVRRASRGRCRPRLHPGGLRRGRRRLPAAAARARAGVARSLGAPRSRRSRTASLLSSRRASRGDPPALRESSSMS